MARGPVPDNYSGLKPTAGQPTRTCPQCGKPRNALAVHRLDADGNRACVECITGGRSLTRSVVLWMGSAAAEEVVPAGR